MEASLATWLHIIVATLVMVTLPCAAAAQCTAESGARRVALLELFTSEGCDSCPPADRWVSGLLERGLDRGRVVTLGFHVDYWNYLGWNDPFAKAGYSDRQRTASRRNQARIVYTPQLLLNGKDYRRGTFKDDIADRVGTINRDPPKAWLSLKLAAEPQGMLSVQGMAVVMAETETGEIRAHLALYENNLANQITAGENRGTRLRHDYVVRELAGPYPFDAHGSVMLGHRFSLKPSWKTADLNVAAFIQNDRTGDVLQSLALPYCR